MTTDPRQMQPGESIVDYVERRAQDPTSFVAMRRATQRAYLDAWEDITADWVPVPRRAIEYPRPESFH